MYVIINNTIEKVTYASEQDLIEYFEQLCQSATSNPRRGKEFAQAKDLLANLSTSKTYTELTQKLDEVDTYRKYHVAQPTNKRQPTHWAEAMLLKNR